ncbi:FAD-dependent monooxygenase [Nocardia ninae]|uniref:Monooxygenase n=1 Tax=Nocardia ninae NBRC 108245 TaxID=1210091 RepID=A0A511MCH3_9NOCA|nr:FAD-dependent monooxygenase [Nocardia ninae]GEM38363.1 monooxygenase [Nocardia ninae NBRC 108245]
MSTAVVVGGGIGGLSAALGLERAGWKVTVLERAQEFRPVGAGLMLAPNAVRALNWLGLADRLRELDTAQGATGIRTASGRWLLQGDVTEVRRRFGVSGYMLHRADAHAMLIGALVHTHLQTGHRVTGVDPETGTVTFQRPSGESATLRADLVVAADGLDSPTRAQLFPGHPRPIYAGYLTWRGVVPAEAAADIEVGRSLIESWGRGKRFGIMPLTDGRVYWYATLPAPPNSHPHDSIEAVARRFRDWHDPIPRLLAATPPKSLLRHDIYSLETALPTYTRGRVVLLGDAAHASTPDLGQGAAQALEDAATLGGLAAKASTAESLAGDYDLARRPRTQELARVAASSGRIAQWRNPLKVAFRNGLVWLTPRSMYLSAMDNALSWTPETAFAAR